MNTTVEFIPNQAKITPDVIPPHICTEIINNYNVDSNKMELNKMELNKMELNKMELNNSEMVKNLWNVIKTYAPPVCEYENIIDHGPIKIYKYQENQVHGGFSPKISVSDRPSTDRPVIKVIVYLNENFEGGITKFSLLDQSYYDIHPKVGAVVMFHKSIKYEEMPVTQGIKYCLKFDILYGSQQVTPKISSPLFGSIPSTVTSNSSFNSTTKPFTFGSIPSTVTSNSSSFNSTPVNSFTFGSNSSTPNFSTPSSFSSTPSNSFIQTPTKPFTFGSNTFGSNPSTPSSFLSKPNQIENQFETTNPKESLKNVEMFTFVGSNGLKFMDVEYKGEWLTDDLDNEESKQRWNEVSRMEHVFKIETRFPGFVDTSMGRPPTDSEDYCVNCYEILPLDTDYKNCSGCLSKIISTNENLRQKLLANRSVVCGVEYKQGHSVYKCQEQATIMGACGKKTCMTHSRRVNYTLKE
jgi:hypothetical protein